MKREIANARWANDSKTKVWCTFRYEDGKILNAVVQDTEEGNPDWKEIMELFSREVLDKNTEDFLQGMREQKKFEEQKHKERQETMKNEAIFNAKLEAFSIEEIKNSKNTELKSKIRRAKTIMEVTAYTSLLLVTESLQTPKKTKKAKAEQTE